MLTVLSSASARPNFVKLAAVHHALSKHKNIKHVIVHTGQHYDPLLSDIFFTQLRIPQPDLNLGIKGGDREEVIDSTMMAMEKAIEKFKPDIVLVYGDVNGAVGAARATKNKGIRLGHVEAGLRSFDESMPEELNRIEIDQLADDLFVSEQSGLENLEVEGMKGRRHFVGNTMIDTLIRNKNIFSGTTRVVQEQLSKLNGKKYAIATIHRPSNVDDRSVLLPLMRFLEEVATEFPILLPVHPRLKNALHNIAFSSERLLLTDPKSYFEFLTLMHSASFILTDSGGIQEEATFLQKRCFTLRRNTERPSTIKSGSNILIDPNDEFDRKKVLDFAKNPVTPKITIPEKWDGKAGERIADIVGDL